MTSIETNWLLGAASGAMLKKQRQARGASDMRSFRFAAVAIVLAASATLLPGRVLAQMGGSDGPHINMMADGPAKTPDEIEAEQQRNQAYKDSLKKIPDVKGSNDPWGGVRTSDAPKTVQPKTAASAKPKSKAGSSQN
jgi:hypothetical protein